MKTPRIIILKNLIQKQSKKRFQKRSYKMSAIRKYTDCLELIANEIKVRTVEFSTVLISDVEAVKTGKINNQPANF